MIRQEFLNEVQGPGEHSVEWNTAGQADGIYFYRVEAGKEVQSLKVRLLR